MLPGSWVILVILKKKLNRGGIPLNFYEGVEV